MTNEWAPLVNGSLSMMCAVFTALLIGTLFLSAHWRRVIAVKSMSLCMTFTFALLVCDGVAQLFLVENEIWFKVFVTLAESFSLLVEWCFGLFIVSKVSISKKLKRCILIPLGVICLAGCVIYSVNLFYPIIYDFQTAQFLSQGAYWGFAGFNYLFFAVSVILMLFRGEHLSIHDRIFLLLAPMLPLTSFLWDSLIPGLSSWNLLIFVAVAATYIRMMVSMAETAQEKTEQLEMKKIRATLERIKPHYIYNVLASIYYLCDRDVGTAKEAIHIFSDYLRDVLNMMEAQTLIPFSQELQTVRNYLELEQMRFGDHIRVRYQIDTDSFLVPPFVVQPLVENSVKHGAEHSEDCGEIVIATYDRPDSYVVIISDSFEGFNAEQSDSGEGSGTKYVCDILSMTVGGNLRINSKPGVGTVSVITIPKQKQ